MSSVSINGESASTSVVINPSPTGSTTFSPSPAVNVGVRGPQGPEGPQGPAGPPGPAGGGTFDYEQMVPATVWTINHNLGRYPAVTVTDYSGSVVYGDVHYVNTNEVTITFSGSQGGYVHCS